ncbi:hypothetical protein [Prevotella sp.]|uniref:hypothetical protein n=1 Tax=Prevotella sp. TaxID=59823 RepID=UPI003AF85F17
MTDRQIISLLKRYMDGATTVEEETALAEFFGRATDDDRPYDISADDWRTYKEMFGMFAPKTVAKDQQEEAAADAKQCFTLRKVALWWHRLLQWLRSCLLFRHCFPTKCSLSSRWLSRQAGLFRQILLLTAFQPNSRSVLWQTV